MIFQKMDSVKQENFKKIKDLKHSSFEGFILEEFHQIQWLIDSKNPIYQVEYIISSREDNLQILREKYELPWKVLFYSSPALLKSVTTNNRMDTVAYISRLPNKIHCTDKIHCPEEGTILVLDNIMDHGNIGSIIRNSYMMGVDTFIMINQFNCFYNKIIDASRGLIFLSNLLLYKTTEEAIGFLEKNNYYPIIAAIDGEPLENLKNNLFQDKKLGIILGNEKDGCSSQWDTVKKFKVKISMRENTPCDSLNVSASAAILVHQLIKK